MLIKVFKVIDRVTQMAVVVVVCECVHVWCVWCGVVCVRACVRACMCVLCIDYFMLCKVIH